MTLLRLGFLAATILLFPSQMFSQTPPGIAWQKCFGGTQDDTGYGITATADGGFFFAGCAGSSDGDILFGPQEEQHGGTCDFWGAKTDASGNLQFKVHLGGTGTDVARTPLQTTDGNYLIGGSTGSNDVDVTGNHGDLDFWLTKVTAAGGVIWKKCYGGTGYDDFGAVVNDDDNGLAMCGGTLSNNGDVSGNHGSSDFWLVKTDADGNILWQKCFGGSGYEKAFDIKRCADGGFILAGFTESNDGDVSGNHSTDYDGWVIKTDASGNLQWQRCLGGSSQDGFFKIVQLSNSNFVMAGYAFSANGDIDVNRGKDDAWLVSLDPDGNLLWSRTYGGDSSDEFYSVKEDLLGKLLVAGFSKSFDGDVGSNYGDKDYWVLRLDTNGDILWDTTYGGTYADVCYDIALSSDGTAALTGYTTSNDYDVSGNHGAIDPYEAKKDYWVVKLESVVGIATEETDAVSLTPSLATRHVQISWNGRPETGSEIIIRNISGVAVKRITASGKSSISIEVSNLPQGIYFVEIRAEKKRLIGKFIKQ
jgi:hypothetical protein